ncbi:MAG TPA: hypothetical protein VHZ30_04065 [Verrucomicrobiae bacterium]|nr:hypothetical protein [Verrucomicrobiae bacterium]
MGDGSLAVRVKGGHDGRLVFDETTAAKLNRWLSVRHGRVRAGSPHFQASGAGVLCHKRGGNKVP